MSSFTVIMVNGKIPCLSLNISTCRGCGQQIGWAETKAGKKMPYDLDDEKNTAHWATCKQARTFRRKS